MKGRLSAHREVLSRVHLENKPLLDLGEGQRAFSLMTPPLGSPAHRRRLRNMVKVLSDAGTRLRDDGSVEWGARIPHFISVALSYACQCDCLHCSAHDYRQKVRREGGALTTAELKGAVGDAVDLGATCILLVGGEPLLHPDLLGIVSAVDRSRAAATIFTNGEYLAGKAAALKQAGLYGAYVSLDSSDPARHDLNRRREGLFDKALLGIAECRARGIVTGISTVVTREKLENGETEAMMALARDLGVLEVFLFDAIPTGRLGGERECALREEDSRAVDELRRRYNALPDYPRVVHQTMFTSLAYPCAAEGCPAGVTYMHLRGNGDVSPCDFTPLSFGNIRERSLGEIWKDLVASELYAPQVKRCRMSTPRFLDGIGRETGPAEAGAQDGSFQPCGRKALLEFAAAPALPPGGRRDDVLPLPLTPLERYMLDDDHPSWPLNWFCRLRFSGRMDRSALQAALKTALTRHPLLSALLEQRGGPPLWVRTRAEPRVTWYGGEDAGDLPAMTGINLRTEPGVRARVVEGPGTTELLLQFHHACCDGVGSLRFIRDLLTLYAMGPVALRGLEPGRLAMRGSHDVAPRRLPGFAWGQMRGFDESLAALFRTPAPLADEGISTAAGCLTASYPSSHTVVFSPEETAGLRETARARGVTVNEIIARDILVATGGWRSRRGLGDDNEWLRLLMPVNLRNGGDRLLPACSKLSYLMFHSRRRDGADPDRVLADVHRYMEKVRRCGLESTFVLWIRALQAFPKVYRRILRPGRCWTTTVLTNLGSPLAAAPVPRLDGRALLGDLVLEGIDVLPSVRSGTAASFGAVQYAGRLNVTMHYDGGSLSRGEARELLDGFAAGTRRSILAPS